MWLVALTLYVLTQQVYFFGQFNKHMNDIISDLFPSLIGGRLNDLNTSTIPNAKKDGQCDKPINRFFPGRSTSSCKPLENLIIRARKSCDQQQLKPNKRKPSVKRKVKISKSRIKLINSIALEQNNSTHAKKSKSVIQSPVNQKKEDELLAKRMKDRIRKAEGRKTPEGRLAALKASRKFRTSKEGKEKIKVYQKKYKNSPKGIISNSVSNAKSNTRISALNKGRSLKEAIKAGEKAAKDKKADLLEVLNTPCLQTPPR